MPRRSSRRTTGPVGGAIRVSVDNNHCHLYAICQQEAPEVFTVVADRQLVVDSSPGSGEVERVLQAARVCPMQAITVEVVR